MCGGGWLCRGRGFEPGFEAAGLAEELDVGLMELEAGIHDAEVFVALGDAGLLLVLGGHLRGIGVAGAGLQLQVEDVELL